MPYAAEQTSPVDTPQPDDLVGFGLCVLLPQRLYLFFEKTQNSEDSPWSRNLRFQMVLSRN